MNYDAVCISGGPVKSLPGKGLGWFGGMGVVYGTEKTTDLESDFFTARSRLSLQEGDTVRTFYRHGGDRVAGKTELTRSSFRPQPGGIWFEGRLDLNDPLQRRVNNLVVKNKLGFSTGSLSHLVVKERKGSANEIVAWPVGELSLTPTPCEPRTRVVSLKSLMSGSAGFTETDLERWEAEQETLADQYLLAVGGGLNKKSLAAEQRAREIYVELLKSQHEMRMREFERSVHHDSRAEEQQYYSAMAQLQLEKLEKMMRR
jgi:hypothetical protein